MPPMRTSAGTPVLSFRCSKRFRENVFGWVLFPVNSSKAIVSMLKLARAGFKGGVASIGSEAGPDSVNLDRLGSSRDTLRACLADTSVMQGRTLDKNHIPQIETGKVKFTTSCGILYGREESMPVLDEIKFQDYVASFCPDK